MTPVTQEDPLIVLSLHRMDAKAATETVRAFLVDNPQGGERLYKAFRAWTWSALTQRRYGSDMRAWFQLMDRTCALLEARDQLRAACRIESLRDLVYESVLFGEHEAPADILGRAHVRAILATMTPNGSTQRGDLAKATKLKDSNLSRVLLMMQSASLIEREKDGKEALFVLTHVGEKARRSLAKAETNPDAKDARHAKDAKIKDAVAEAFDAHVKRLAGRKAKPNRRVKYAKSKFVVASKHDQPGTLKPVRARTVAAGTVLSNPRPVSRSRPRHHDTRPQLITTRDAKPHNG